jgi:hypothetical protein
MKTISAIALVIGTLACGCSAETSSSDNASSGQDMSTDAVVSDGVAHTFACHINGGGIPEPTDDLTVTVDGKTATIEEGGDHLKKSGPIDLKYRPTTYKDYYRYFVDGFDPNAKDGSGSDFLIQKEMLEPKPGTAYRIYLETSTGGFSSIDFTCKASS